jgi:hypothetical protein
MHPRKPPSESVLLRAVEARAAGGGWEAVAKLVHRSPHTVRKWPHTYSERWSAALRRAERTVIDSAAAESVRVLRTLLHSEDDRVRVEAAWRLVYQRLEQHKIDLKTAEQFPVETPSDAYRIASFVKAHTHERLTQLVANLLRARVPRGLVLASEPAAGVA